MSVLGIVGSVPESVLYPTSYPQVVRNGHVVSEYKDQRSFRQCDGNKEASRSDGVTDIKRPVVQKV